MLRRPQIRWDKGRKMMMGILDTFKCITFLDGRVLLINKAFALTGIGIIAFCFEVPLRSFVRGP